MHFNCKAQIEYNVMWFTLKLLSSMNNFGYLITVEQIIVQIVKRLFFLKSRFLPSS